MHPTAGIHVLLLGTKGAAHAPIGVRPEIKRPDHLVEGVFQVIGVPAGELTFIDGFSGDHECLPSECACL